MDIRLRDFDGMDDVEECTGCPGITECSFSATGSLIRNLLPDESVEERESKLFETSISV